MSLRELLTIYHLRIKYTDDEWIFIDIDSGRIVETVTKTKGDNPFMPMRAAGLLQPDHVLREIEAYNAVRPRNEHVTSDFRTYRRNHGMVEGDFKEAVTPHLHRGKPRKGG